MDDRAGRLAKLSPKKQALLSRRINWQDRNIAKGSITPQKRDEAALQLSFAQQRLWLLTQIEPDTPLYNIINNIHLHGKINTGAVERTLQEIVRRHEVLRTTFAVNDDKVIQIIAPSLQLPLPLFDLEVLPKAERYIEALRFATEEAQRPFDLSKGPLFRAQLLRLGDEEHILLLTIHHIVFDGWSKGVFINEMNVLYQAFSTEQPSPLSPLPIQYADYAIWQRSWFQGETREHYIAYWKEKLAGAANVLTLPTDRTRPSIQTNHGAIYFFELPANLSKKLMHLCQQEGTTLSMTLLAAFKVLITRYTGQEDVIVGMPVANRTHAEIEGLIGCFINTIVLRTDLSNNPTFLEVLKRVRDVALGAYAHQEMPFEQLVEALHLARDPSHTPLFQIEFAPQPPTAAMLSLPELALHPLLTHSGTAKFDLSLYVAEETSGVSAALEYNTDLFDATTIERIAAHFETLLENITAEPTLRLWDIPILTAKQKLLFMDWNATETPYPQEKCLHQLFEAQADRSPDAVALICGEKQLTYSEVNTYANRLAHHLQRQGVRPEVRVGICIERSLELIVGLLGILKAGGAYVPLDPNYPKERLTFMLTDANVSILLTEERLVERLPGHTAKVICLDKDLAALAGESETNPTSPVVAQNLAYVMYTSGSTGTPKGVLGTHQATLNCFFWMWQAYPFQVDEVCCQKTSLSFGDSIQEIFGPLLQGLPLVLIPDEVVRDPYQLVEVLASHRVTRIILVPSLLQAILASHQKLESRLPDLTLWIASGEALPAELAYRFYESMPHQSLVNLYGASEISNDVSWYEITPTGEPLHSIPIGRPIANMQCYILDSRMSLVPIGVPGELYVGGWGLNRGYLERSALTAEKFVPNPFSPIPGTRLYRTGDLARYLPDRNIEYVGRIDHQVKLRGYRIELGEIEAVLLRHTDIREAVVLVRKDHLEEKRLTAYIVFHVGKSSTASGLRRFCQQHLTDYMIPMAWVFVEALPLTPSGKIDRLALSALNQVRPDLDDEYVPPRTPVEEHLAGIWAQLLGLERVGIYDNFFSLGGDSLLLVQTVNKIRQAGYQLAVKQMVQYQTIDELAGYLSQASTVQETASSGPQKDIIADFVPLTLTQRTFLDTHLGDELHRWSITALLEAPDALDLVVLERAVQHILVRHTALRSRFNYDQGIWRQSISSPNDDTPFMVMNLAELTESIQTMAIERATANLQASLNLFDGPLLRVVLFELGVQRPGRLLVVVHRIACDDVSFQILSEDLWKAYHAPS